MIPQRTDYSCRFKEFLQKIFKRRFFGDSFRLLEIISPGFILRLFTWLFLSGNTSKIPLESSSKKFYKLLYGISPGFFPVIPLGIHLMIFLGICPWILFLFQENLLLFLGAYWDFLQEWLQRFLKEFLYRLLLEYLSVFFQDIRWEISLTTIFPMIHSIIDAKILYLGICP